MGLAAAQQVQGKELSFNNLNDTDTALALVAEFAEPAVAIIKHANPCGVPWRATVVEAYRKALACDPLSAFGGIVACNRPLDGRGGGRDRADLHRGGDRPGVDAAAREHLRRQAGAAPAGLDKPARSGGAGPDIKWLTGGFLVQDRDTARLLPPSCARHAAPADARGARRSPFAWQVVRHVKSNAIVLARGGATVGIGMGQTSRVDAVQLAVKPGAREHAGSRPCVVARRPSSRSPTASWPQSRPAPPPRSSPAAASATREVIEAADKAGIAMVFTGVRHFRH